MQYWLDNKEHYLYQDGQANKVMVIFELPINNRNDFLEGNYSKLYPPEVLLKLIDEYQTYKGIQYPDPRHGIITKTDIQREIFETKRNKDFNLKVPIPVTLDVEYEYPPGIAREIFNYGIKGKI